ncbi:MAG: peptidoglycan DD-metalloendopeptidase family protein [Candidatus Cloacimonetes bacterium]|nr:peptidoglycan DD-metalloendopeptidase family protein [Candidatus Cloacimonadota bacterium]
MRHHAWLILLLAAVCLPLWAQNVDSRRTELEELQRQISESERLMREVEQRASGAQRDLQENRRSYRRIRGALRELETQENRLAQELTTVQASLAQNTLRIQVLSELCRGEFRELFYADINQRLELGDAPEPLLLVLLINTTTGELGRYQGERDELDSAHSRRQEAWSSARQERHSVSEQRQSAGVQLSELETNLANIEHERQGYLTHIDELRARAQAIEELIARIELASETGEYSYRFTREHIVWPARGRVVRPFGEYRGEDPRIKFMSNGIDIAVPVGTEVQCVDDGVVMFSEWYPRTGKVVIVDHQNGFLSTYSHNSQLLVTVGDSVKRGQLVALSGDSGATGEPLLHFELRKRRVPVDPMAYLE